MPFAPGQSGNPAGRPKGTYSGRTRALQIIDDMLAQAENLDALRAAMQAEFQKNPVRFFMRVVMPLLPKDARIEVVENGPVAWQSFLSRPADSAADS